MSLNLTFYKELKRELGFLAQRIRHEISEPKSKEAFLDHVRKILTMIDNRNTTLTEKIESARNELYNKLPSGEVHAFELIEIIKKHIETLDEIIEECK